VLELVTDDDASLEVWGLEGTGKAFRRAFGLDLEVRVKGTRQ
jgi:hypothetical protein